LTIILGAFIAIIIGFWLAMLFGAGTRISPRVRRTFQKPFPVLMLAVLEKLALTPPHWLERWAFIASLTGMERSFSVVYRDLRWLGGKTAPAQTPAEAAAALTGRLPGATPEIQVLLDQYQRSLFSMTPGDLHVARRAAESIRRKSIRAVVSSRLAPLQRLFRKIR
jgi:hypothetical protein